MKRYYFDFAASTPVDPGVLRAMLPFFSDKFGNPGSLHSFGQDAISAVDNARKVIAESIGAGHGQIVFTSSATEANNLGIKGAFLKAKDLPRFKKAKIIVSAVEHESVLESARDLENLGAEIVYLSVDKNGVVDLKKFKKELTSKVILVSVMLGNNEVGTIEPVKEISEIIREFRGKDNYPLFHSDAAQAFSYMGVDVAKLGVDLLTISSQKIYGPKGAGALYIKEKKLIAPIISGGSQEYGFRSGTENVPAIVGFGEAIRISARIKKNEAKRLLGLKHHFIERTQSALPYVEINGAIEDMASLPHIINVYFPKERAEELLTKLDMAGFAVSAGSACRARSTEPSHVVLAMGYDKKRALGSIRISFGKSTTKSDVDKLIQNLKK